MGEFTFSRAVLPILAALVVLVASPALADECTCSRQASLGASFEKADVVFQGVVLRVEYPKVIQRVVKGTSVTVTTGGPTMTTFHAAEMFRGNAGELIQLAAVPNNCDITFQPGEAWLVYANRLRGHLVTDLCTRTRLRDSASQDLAYLRGRQRKTPQGVVYGDVKRRFVDEFGNRGLYPLLEPLTVVAVSDGRRWTVLTERGRPYAIVLPAGTYEIQAERRGVIVSAVLSVRIKNGDEIQLRLIADYRDQEVGR